MAVVYGFGGLRIKESGLYLHPRIPGQWTAYRFRFRYEDAVAEVSVDKSGCTISLLEGNPKEIHVYGRECRLEAGREIRVTQ